MLIDNIVPARVLVDRRRAKYKDEWDDATYEAITARAVSYTHLTLPTIYSV